MTAEPWTLADSSPTPTGTPKRRDVTAAVPATSRGCIAIGSNHAVMRRLKTSESVARDIVHDILSNGMKPGDGLPSETAMLAQYGVSRESLREGLRLLEVQGLITIRRGPGGGPVVGTVDPANLGRISTLYYHMARATYNELFEAWALAECLLAERAARNPDRDARAAAMAPYLEHDAAHKAPEELEKFVQEHAGFHAAVGSLVRNRVLELTLQTVGQIVSHHVAYVDDPRMMRDLIADGHLKLAKEIVAGHPNQARILMEDHVREIGTYGRERLGAKMDDLIEWH